MDIGSVVYDPEQRGIRLVIIAIFIRITSYNVCYTKLLRTDEALRSRLTAAGQQRVVREFDNRQLIRELAEMFAREGLGQSAKDAGRRRNNFV